MKRYSHLFSTLHDEDTPVGNFAYGAHYSILRAVIWDVDPKALPTYHDFAILWDEDHDDRVIWTVEQLYIRRMLPSVLAIGERKGSVTAIVVPGTPRSFEKKLEEITQENPGDSWCADVGTLEEPNGLGCPSRATDYLRGIDALWHLGAHPVVPPPPPELPAFLRGVDKAAPSGVLPASPLRGQGKPTS